MPDILQHLQERVTELRSNAGQFVRGLHLRHRARGLRRHLKRGRHGIGALAVLVAAWALPLLWATTPDTHMRWVGAILQIAGVGTVAYGLSKTRELFDVQSVWEFVVDWLRDVPQALGRPQDIHGSGTGAGAITGGGSAHGVGSAPRVKDATLEGRIAILEKEQRRIREEMTKLRNHVDEQAKEYDQKLEMEESARKRADEKIKEQIKEVSIGGLHLEVVGLIWLVIGIFVATVPDFAGTFLSWL